MADIDDEDIDPACNVPMLDEAIKTIYGALRDYQNTSGDPYAAPRMMGFLTRLVGQALHHQNFSLDEAIEWVREYLAEVWAEAAAKGD